MKYKLSYAIGVAEPTSIRIETFGTGKLSAKKKSVNLFETFLIYAPKGLLPCLDLLRPIYGPQLPMATLDVKNLDLPGKKPTNQSF